ncbi:glycosyltransferase family 1 protein [Mucilaginibacter terrigena]|uniref:Glycosyltransferase family 1 protein n=1 Tax=Mucilaginibacter terrigena TaxID=2492395 RepID=A0A4V1ZBH7_9SPHI|nr:glycosyltransferase family 1 protein [Mucilaginibacter terrigena]RYU87360.1 glycosyltransferase family 1 protein [Mucilaginibacter terrigena]
MKILFDHQKFSLQRYGGISRYFAGLNAGLNTRPGISSKICGLYSENEYIKDLHLPFNNAAGKFLFHGHRNRIIRWNRRFCEWNLRQNNFDIFHPTYYDPYFLKYIKRPFVVTVHDMIHESLPQLFGDAAEVIAQKKQLIASADAIIAISQHTKQDLIKYYPHAEHKITVVHHGYIPNTASADAGLTLPDKYILFVGERWHYKNFIFFVKAISKLLNHDKELHLVCAGGGAFTNAEKELFADLNISSQCHQVSATDSELKQMYCQARLFAFPSLQEGFGFPLLEAFANNCPVVCSNTTCFPEVAGDAALYFDPADEASISAAIEKVLYDDAARQNLISKGQQNLQTYTFDKCIDNAIQVYSTLLKSL